MGPTSIRSRGPVAVALLAAAVVLAATPAVRALAKNSKSVVKATANATAPDADGRQTVTVTLQIDKPWHLYANPVGNKDLTDNQTTVTVGARAKPEEVKVEYPAGTVARDKTLGAYKVYEDKATIKAHVRRARGDTSPLHLEVEVQACDQNKCLPPGTIKIEVP